VEIHYHINAPVSAAQFADVLQRSGLAERRPADDLECLAGMLRHANLTVTAWHDKTLVGIARSVTDFHYCCYLSDLAVDRELAGHGIGTRLQSLTQEQLGPRCTLILLAAPAADSFYAHIGFERHERAWVLDRDSRLPDRRPGPDR